MSEETKMATGEPAKKRKKYGPQPTGRRSKGMAVPFFFKDEAAGAYREMPTKTNDVFLASIVKGGTTWMHKILFSLLHEIDDDGNIIPGSKEMLGGNGQIYPEALPLKRSATNTCIFGNWGFEDLVAQKSPRIFTSHLPPDFLPKDFCKKGGKGKIIIQLRNLKDVLASLHFFKGEAKDGWLGNESGSGSLARFLDKDSPNAFGPPFRWVREFDELATKLAGEGRVCVLYFEELKRALPEQLKRLSDFLGLQASEAKLATVVKNVSFNAMKTSNPFSNILLRKGQIGDWRNHMSPKEWALFDEVFEEELGDSALAQPMRHFHHMEVPGLPPPESEQLIEVDPRQWPKFDRVTLNGGMVVRDRLIPSSQSSESKRRTGFVRPPSGDWKEGRAAFEAEAGRYHLFVSRVCPWASGVMAVREMLGLQDVVSVDVADGQSGAGWIFLEGSRCPDFSGSKPFFLYEVYQRADPCITTRITVPVLWDSKTHLIVSNDSWDIMRLLATDFPPLGLHQIPPLYPPSAKAEIDSLHAEVYPRLLNGVYRAGVGLLRGNQKAAHEAANEVYLMLDKLETKLSKSRFLTADKVTVIDVRTVMTLLRYDAAYRIGFVLSGGKGGILVDCGYPNICGFVREMYSMFKSTVVWPSFRQYYRWSVGTLPCSEPLPDLRAIVASAEAAHGRSALSLSSS